MGFFRCSIRGVGFQALCVAALLGAAVRISAQYGWEPPVALMPTASSDAGDDVFPVVIAGDPAGSWVAFFVENWSSSSFGGDLYRSRSTDNGRTWSAPVPVQSAYSNGVRVARQADGTMIAVWHHYGGASDIYYSRSTDGGITWSAAAMLPSQSAWDYFPTIATDGQGHWICVHEVHVGGDPVDYDIYYTRSLDNGITWTPSAILLGSMSVAGEADDRTPIVDTDGQGNWIATWYSSNTLGGTLPSGFNYLMHSHSIDNGATWSPIDTVTTGAVIIEGSMGELPATITDRQGTWMAVAHSNTGIGGSGSDFDIVITRSTDNGVTWSPWALLSPEAASGTGGDSYPNVATDGRGRWVTLWTSGEPLDAKGTDNDPVYSQSFDNGATWTTPRPVSAWAIGDTNNEVAWTIATNSHGNWLCTWYGAGRNGSDHDVYTETGCPDATTSTLTLDFGSILVDAGSTGPLTLNVASDGMTTLVVSGCQITGTDMGDFLFSPVPVPNLGEIPPGQTRSVGVAFDPSTAGSKGASVVVNSNDPVDPAIAVPMQGVGTACAAARDWFLLQ